MRGELILDLESLKNLREELKKKNKGKRGPHYQIAGSYTLFLAAVRRQDGGLRSVFNGPVSRTYTVAGGKAGVLRFQSLF